jgi:LacI family transcriptional regulator, repressor for deo operon, udp, cdd, tsx, nupC, and nupG
LAAGKIRTMEEFSAASGISRPTISRYFNDPASVRAATRAQIEAALKRLNYRPNLFAVNFNRKQTKTFGMLVPSLTDPFYAELVERVELRALRHGYWTIVLNSHGERPMETRALQTLMSLRVAGAIVAPLGVRSDRTALRELGKSLPLLLLDSRLDARASFVGTDNRQSISLLVDYLHRTGEPPCYFDMPNVNRNAVDRRQAYVLAMEKWGSEPNIVAPPTQSWAFEAVGFEQANLAFAAGALPSRTILCANDRTAFGVMAAATQRGLRVSRDVNADLRVAGHDDHPLSRFASPSLTTVAQDFDRMATLAVDMLISRLAESKESKKEQPGEVHLLEAKLIMRDSA